MTMAVRFKCGSIKFGAFCPCPECNQRHGMEDDLSLSMAVTGSCSLVDQLDQVAAVVCDGSPSHLDPAPRAQLIVMLRESDMSAQLQNMRENEKEKLSVVTFSEQRN